MILRPVYTRLKLSCRTKSNSKSTYIITKISCSDLLTKFDDLVKRFTHEFKEIIKGERAKLKAELDEYNAEKQKMKAIEVNDDDIISLNVGGQKFTTTRSTLCQVEGSLLTIMFSGRWERGLKRDQDGAVFFDFNPQYFNYILEYLRTKKIATPEERAELPKIPRNDLKNFTTLVRYLGLSEEIVVSADETNEVVPTAIVQSEKFNLHGPEITLQQEGKVAVHSSNSRHEYVFGENIYQQGIVHLKLKLESFHNNGWLLVGIVKQDAVQQNNGRSYEWPGSYGWALGGSGRIWKNGSVTIDNSLKNLTKQGDTVKLVLDYDAAKLSLHLPTSQKFHIDLPKSQTWRLHVNMHYPNDKVHITDE